MTRKPCVPRQSLPYASTEMRSDLNDTQIIAWSGCKVGVSPIPHGQTLNEGLKKAEVDAGERAGMPTGPRRAQSLR